MSIETTVAELAGEFGKTKAGEVIYEILAKLEEYEQRLQALEKTSPAPSAHSASDSAHDQQAGS